jgi:hypothetical protein
MHLRAIIQTSCLALVIVIAVAVVGGAAAATQPRPPVGFYSPAATKAIEARHKAMARLGDENQLSPAERVAIQEDARRYDPRIYTPGTTLPERPTRSVVEIVTSGGFHWVDAGVGVGSAFAVVLLALGAAILVRSNRLTKA